MIIENVLNKDQCESITNAMFTLMHSGKLIDELNDNAAYGNSLGFRDLPETIDNLTNIEDIVKKHYPNIEFQNNFTRIYRNDSYLNFHTDRNGLELTLSVCVFSNLENPWPLCVSKISVTNNDPIVISMMGVDYMKKHFKEYHTPVGSAALMEGTKYPHWRDKLSCNREQYVIQSFYHWKFL
jgi:hypothetical protein